MELADYRLHLFDTLRFGEAVRAVSGVTVYANGTKGTAKRDRLFTLVDDNLPAVLRQLAMVLEHKGSMEEVAAEVKAATAAEAAHATPGS